MPMGPGKYDDLATIVRAQAAAAGVLVVVIDGAAGSGFSVQATPETSARLLGAVKYRLAYHRPFVLPKRDGCGATGPCR